MTVVVDDTIVDAILDRHAGTKLAATGGKQMHPRSEPTRGGVTVVHV